MSNHITSSQRADQICHHRRARHGMEPASRPGRADGQLNAGHPRARTSWSSPCAARLGRRARNRFGAAALSGRRLPRRSSKSVGKALLLVLGPGWRGLSVRGRVRRRASRDRLGRDGRAREALGLLRWDLFTLTTGRLTLSGARTMAVQRFAGLRRSTVVHQGALAGALALILGPRIGKFGPMAGPIRPGPQHPACRLGTLILWFTSLQPGLIFRSPRRHRVLRRHPRRRRQTAPPGRGHRWSRGSASPTSR